MITVHSSNLAAVGYWAVILTIAFRSGGTYEYYRVPYSEYAGLLNASSHGRYFHRRIKGRYSYRKVSR